MVEERWLRWKQALPLRDVCWILLAMAVGTGLRFYRLGEQSLWFDDYNNYVCVLEPAFKGYWESIFGVCSFNGEQVPLFFLVFFAWSRLVGTGLVAMRALSVCLGVATIPLVFLTGKRMFGRTAGGVAALCFALSPVHIFYGQEVRQCALVALLGAASIYALVKAYQDGRTSSWILHFACNVLLLWTHLFGAFLLLAEGLLLLGTARGRVRRAVVWFGAHGAAVVPVLLWVILRIHLTETAYDLYQVPSFQSVFFDLAADDAVNLNHTLFPQTTALNAFPLDAALGWLLALFGSGCLVWGVYRAAVSRRERSLVWLLLSVVAVPVLTLAVLSVYWRPCIFPRYTLYSSVALYVLMGGAVAALPARPWRFAAGVLLAALMGYQLLHTVPNATRTQWKQVAEFVHANGGAEDAVLIGWPGGTTEIAQSIFRMYSGAARNPVLPAFSIADAVNTAACLLEKGKGIRQAWAAFQMNYRRGAFEAFESGLRASGIAFDRTEFDAMDGVNLYRLYPAPAKTTDSGTHCAGVFLKMAVDALERGDPDKASGYLDTADGCGGDDSALIGRLRPALNSGEGRARLLETFAAARRGHEYQWRGNLTAAADAFREARQYAPELDVVHDEFASVLLKIGLAYAEIGDRKAALAALRELGDLEAPARWVCLHLVACLDTNAPVDGAVAAVRLLLQAFSYAGKPESQIEFCGKAIARDPSCAAGYGVLGEALLAQRKYPEALEALERHNALTAGYGPVQFAMGRVLLALGRPEEARESFAKGLALPPATGAVYKVFLDALLGARDRAQAAAELDRLRREGQEVFPEFSDALQRLADPAAPS